MREAAERRVAPVGGLTPLQRLVAPGDHERIVRIFGAEAAAGMRADLPESVDAADAEAEPDWPAAIQLIRDAGGRIRQARAGAEEATRRAHALVGRSARDAEAAEQRARAAEEATEAALRRAEQAEAARTAAEAAAAAAEATAAAAEAAAAAAEARACRADEDAAAARAAEAEARLWLRRLLACLKTEFAETSDAPDARD